MVNNKKGISLTFILLTLGFFPVVSQAQDLPPEILRYADLVLYNGQVLTMDRDQPPINVTEAVAIRDGRILAAGDDDRILQMAGPDTQRVDLEGKAVVPGFVDTHAHMDREGLKARCGYSLAGRHSVAAIVEAVKNAVALLWVPPIERKAANKGRPAPVLDIIEETRQPLAELG